MWMRENGEKMHRHTQTHKHIRIHLSDKWASFPWLSFIFAAKVFEKRYGFALHSIPFHGYDDDNIAFVQLIRRTIYFTSPFFNSSSWPLRIPMQTNAFNQRKLINTIRFWCEYLLLQVHNGDCLSYSMDRVCHTCMYISSLLGDHVHYHTLQCFSVPLFHYSCAYFCLLFIFFCILLLLLPPSADVGVAVFVVTPSPDN